MESPLSGSTGFWDLDIGPNKKTQTMFLQGEIIAAGWSPDDSIIYGYTYFGRDEFAVYVDNARRVKLTEFATGIITYCDAARASDVMVCSVEDSKSDAWIVENFDPETSSRPR